TGPSRTSRTGGILDTIRIRRSRPAQVPRPGPAEPVEVRPVRGRGELNAFVKLPWRLYEGIDNWVPPLISERRRHLDRKRNPFSAHAEAESSLAWGEGVPVGRISAHVDHYLNEYQDNRWGLFGFYESVDGPAVAAALVDTADAWVRARGRDRLIGPFDFS